MLNDHLKGILFGLAAYCFWGFVALYWSMLSPVAPPEILINRVIMGFFSLLIVLLILRKLNPITEAKKAWSNKKKRLLILASTLIIATNWLVYLYAMTSGRILQASFGNYINPLMTLVFGIVILKEKINRYQVVASLIALGAVVYLTIIQGYLPWVSLTIATTFSLYGLIKKLLKMNPIISLFFEISLMLPVALIFFVNGLISGNSAHLRGDPLIVGLLIGAGVMTITPLLLFAKAANSLPLSTVGFLQYVQPAIQMIVAIFITGEPFSQNTLLAFVFIWIACLIFSASPFLIKRQQVNVEEPAI